MVGSGAKIGHDVANFTPRCFPERVGEGSIKVLAQANMLGKVNTPAVIGLAVNSHVK